MEMRRYSIEPRTRKYAKGYAFLSFARKYKKELLATWLDAVKTASKKVVHKAGEFLGSKITDARTKLNNNKIMKPDENLTKSWKNNYSIGKKRWNIKRFKTSIIIKMEHYKISKLLNYSTLLKIVTKSMSK